MPRPRRWSTWRHTRPLPAAILSALGGLAILTLPADQYTVLAVPGTSGLAGFALGGLITALAALLLTHPQHHTLYGALIVIAALISFVYSNLGGFLIGMLLAITGGSLAYAWTPHTNDPN